MANVENMKFPSLKITGANYIGWTTDVELYLESEKLSDTIKEGNKSTSHEKAKAIIFLRKHLDENVTHDYAHIRDPAELWKELSERFDNQRDITLPHALEEWHNLRFQDFEKVGDYNSALLRIVSQLKYCGKPVSEAEMLEKTYLTFHKENHILQQIYRKCRYKRYSELNAVLRVAETNNDLLLRNHNSRPTGTKAFPEVNATDIKYQEGRHQNNRGRGRRSNRGHGRTNKGKNSMKRVQSDGSSYGKESHTSSSKKHDNICFKCGSKGHWANKCRTSPHLCKLYQESIKGKGKEVNAIFEGTSYLESSDFVSDFDENAHADD